MRLVELSAQDKEQYSRFVMENENGSFLQSWEWGEWQKNLGREACRFFISEDDLSMDSASSPQASSGPNGNNHNIIGAIQLIKMPLPFGKFYLYAPHGPVVDGKNQIASTKFQTIFNEFISKFPKSIFIRIEPKFGILDFGSWNLSFQKTVNIQPGKTLVINLQKPEEQILYEMHPKTRYNIKLAQKHGVRVEKDLVVTPRHGLYFKEVLEQIVQTAKRQGYKGYSKDHYINLISFFALKNHQGDLKLHIYRALYQQQLLASGIMADFSAQGGSASGGGTRTYLFGGSSPEFKNVMAPYLLHWQAILDAKKQAMMFYDFWGVETSAGKEAGFARFKTSFGGQIKNYPGAFDVVQKRGWYFLYKILRFFGKLIR